MLVTKDKLAAYGIANDCYFARRTGSGSPISRDQFYIDNPSRLVVSGYCAIGSDENGWQLEQYNGENWTEVDPDDSYSLIITNGGLAAMTDWMRGGYKLTISGIKLLDTVITNPSTPIINWTDTEFQQAGGIAFTCGTRGSPNPASSLKQILTWRFLSAAGGLQYTINLPADGLGSITDSGQDEWQIGAVGLYVKSNADPNTDVLFAVGCLPNLVYKYSTTVSRIGNAVKIYLNTVLNNLGLVSDLSVIQEDECSIPEVPNESLLLYPNDPMKRPYNCYVVDSLFGTGIPALAVPRVTTSTNPYKPDWAYFQPSDNYLQVGIDAFENVKDYQFVYWDTTVEKYKPAEGRKVGNAADGNDKLPIGLRVGNAIVFSGTIVNQLTHYSYDIQIAEGGANYAIGDELLAAALVDESSHNEILFKVVVTSVNTDGTITALSFDKLNDTSSELLNPNPQTVTLYPDPRSTLETGSGATVEITATAQTGNVWNFPQSWWNKPLYCDQGTNAGNPTIEKTDAFLGWCIDSHSIHLALDLRNEASTTVYGTTRYATIAEVKTNNVNASEQTAITPKALQNNYLKTTKTTDPTPNVNTTAGDTVLNPVVVNTFTKFNEVIIGKNMSGYDYSAIAANTPVSFCGAAYQALWADLAEYYEADREYMPGTLITFGQGEKEIAAATVECNGVISSKPGYVLGKRASDRHLPVALCGRVPVLFDSSCLPTFGAKVYLSAVTPGRASTIPNGKCIGKIIEKNFGSKKLIECVVRIDF